MIKVADHGRVRVLALDRPQQHNALSGELRRALIAALQDAQSDAAVGAVVITGSGKAFAAGADLRELLARDTAAQRSFLSPPHIYSVVEDLTKPVLAAINGHALGAGLELATACDVRIASPAARVGQPEVNLALIPGGGGTQRLVRLVGPGRAAQLVFTGDAIPADEALRIGLVDEVADDPVARAIEVASRMARHDEVALAAAKRALAAAKTGYQDGLAVEIEEFLVLHARDAARRRIVAFLEKRA